MLIHSFGTPGQTNWSIKKPVVFKWNWSVQNWLHAYIFKQENFYTEQLLLTGLVYIQNSTIWPTFMFCFLFCFGSGPGFYQISNVNSLQYWCLEKWYLLYICQMQSLENVSDSWSLIRAKLSEIFHTDVAVIIFGFLCWVFVLSVTLPIFTKSKYCNKIIITELA